MPSSNRAEGAGAGGGPPLRIRPMVEVHLDQVLEIERLAFPTPWTVGHFRHELRNEIALNLVALVGTKVLGYVCVWIVAGELKINNLAVHPDRRGQGLGERLLVKVLAEARNRDCSEASLEVRPSNRAAIRLYRRHGFRTLGRRSGYYEDSGEDALLMVADLAGD